MFGSEGNYGIVTSAIVKLFKKPAVQRYGSVHVQPDSGAGSTLYDAAGRSGCAARASVRVMDNTQFHFGQALASRRQVRGGRPG